MFTKYKYHIALLVSGLCYSSLSLFSALLTEQRVDAFTQILWRAGFGSLTSFLVLALFFKQSLKLNKKELKYTLFNALILVGGFSTFILSIYLGTPIAKAVALVYTYPLSIVPLSMIILKEKPTFKQLVAIGLSLLSVGLLLEIWKIKKLTEFTPGELLALANSVFYSIVIIYGKVIRDNTTLHPTKTVAYSLLFMIPMFWLFGSFLNLTGVNVLNPHIDLGLSIQSWMALVGLGFFGTTLAITFLYSGISKIEPMVAGVLLLTEPLWVTIWGIFIFGQMVSIWSIFGLLGIMVSVLLV